MDLGLPGWLSGLSEGGTLTYQGMSKGPTKLQIRAGDLFWDFHHGWEPGALVANLAKVIYDV